MATHSRILAWTIPWTEEAGGLQSMGSQRLHMTERLDTAQNICRVMSPSAQLILDHLLLPETPPHLLSQFSTIPSSFQV